MSMARFSIIAFHQSNYVIITSHHPRASIHQTKLINKQIRHTTKRRARPARRRSTEASAAQPQEQHRLTGPHSFGSPRSHARTHETSTIFRLDSQSQPPIYGTTYQSLLKLFGSAHLGRPLRSSGRPRLVAALSFFCTTHVLRCSFHTVLDSVCNGP